MAREMRRSRQQLSKDECMDILARGQWGVLALAGDDGFPYAVPLNYVLLDGVLYFHSAKSGYKIDAIRRNSKASFCVVDESDLVPCEFGTAYKSVIVLGCIHTIDDSAAQETVLRALIDALAGGEEESSKRAEIDSCLLRNRVAILALEPECMTGKRASDAVMAAHRQSAESLLA